MVDVDLKGVFNGTRAVLKGMQSRKRGHIINIGSIAALKLFPNHGVCKIQIEKQKTNKQKPKQQT